MAPLKLETATSAFRGSLFDIIFPSSSYFSRSALATVFYNFRANHENRAVRGGMERLQGVSCGPAPRPPRRYVGISHHLSSPSAEAGRGAAPHCACTLVTDGVSLIQTNRNHSSY